MKTIQRCWNLESLLIRYWNFKTTGHVFPPDLEAECHSHASLLAIPPLQCHPVPQDEPGDVSCVFAEQLHHFQRKRKHEMFEGVSVLADLHDQVHQQLLSMACLGSQMLFKNLWWAVLAMHLFIFYSHTPYVGPLAISLNSLSIMFYGACSEHWSTFYGWDDTFIISCCFQWFITFPQNYLWNFLILSY